MIEQTPRILVHPTEGGLWLTPDTAAGWELIERVPPRPAYVQKDASSQPAWEPPLIFGLAFVSVAFLAWSFGRVVPVVILTLFAAGFFMWVGYRARRAWAEMRASGLAVPVPTEWLNSTQLERASRRGKVSRAELVSLPDVQGEPALVWAWKVGQERAAVTTERLPS